MNIPRLFHSGIEPTNKTEICVSHQLPKITPVSPAVAKTIWIRPSVWLIGPPRTCSMTVTSFGRYLSLQDSTRFGRKIFFFNFKDLRGRWLGRRRCYETRQIAQSRRERWIGSSAVSLLHKNNNNNFLKQIKYKRISIIIRIIIVFFSKNLWVFFCSFQILQLSSCLLVKDAENWNCKSTA